MARRSLNLSIEEASVKRAQRYSRRHGVSISRLVEDFLVRLPVDEADVEELTSDVRRLIGIGAGTADRAAYRRYLLEKYGR